MITLKSPATLRERRAILQRGDQRIAVLRFMLEAEKIDLTKGRYVLEWQVAGEPGTPYQVQVTRSGQPVAKSHPSLRLDGSGAATGAMAFEVD